MAETSAEKKDVIEIPVGRYLGAVRSNPWVLATFICAGVALVLLCCNVPWLRSYWKCG